MMTHIYEFFDRPMKTHIYRAMNRRCASATNRVKRWVALDTNVLSTELVAQVDSLAPLNIASSVLECHREDDTHVAGYYRPCEAKHVKLK